MENKNILNLNDFKAMNSGSGLNELVEFVDGSGIVTTDIVIPQQLINAFVKKVKDESGRDIRQNKGDAAIAEMIANYIKTAFVNIENLPVSIVLGQNYTKDAQVQSQSQVQPVQDTAAQIQPVQETQPVQGAQNVQVPVQGVQSAQPAQIQQTQPQSQEI